MKLISHRGNLDSINSARENSPHYIIEAITAGYDVEIDVWSVDQELYLGHDEPQYSIKLDWLKDRRDSVWVHAKNFKALDYLVDKDLRVFYHKQEEQSIINNCNLIWSHDLSNISSRSVIPLLALSDILDYLHYVNVYGICSDFIKTIKTPSL